MLVAVHLNYIRLIDTLTEKEITNLVMCVGLQHWSKQLTENHMGPVQKFNARDVVRSFIHTTVAHGNIALIVGVRKAIDY